MNIYLINRKMKNFFFQFASVDSVALKQRN